MTQRTILLADDDRSIRTVLGRALTGAGYSVRATGTAAGLWRWIEAGEGDLVVTDVIMPDANGLDLLPRIKAARPDLPIIVMSAQTTLLTAIKAAERGAYDYLPKPFDLNELLRVVSKALDTRDEVVDPPSPDLPSLEESLPMIGISPAMQDVYRVLARLLNADLTVMVTGESGTGKELFARALHDYGRRKEGPFVAINMAAIPRELIESELFGHEKGAFTGAHTRSMGRFGQANGGTLFLDEIGDMPLEAQTRLLRVLQEGEYSSVGGHAVIKTDIRIIAATHRDLRVLIREGQFREDLFYRLNVVPLRLPPLRERVEDIPLLARHFFNVVAQEGLSPKTLSRGALDALAAYRWPGNVRELENLVRRLSVLYTEDVINSDVIEAELSEPDIAATSEDEPVSESLTDSVDRHIDRYFAAHAGRMPAPGLYERVLHQIERPLILHTLRATRGNQIRAAEVLGLNRNTLRKKIRTLDITVIRDPK